MLPREHEAFEQAVSRARDELGKGARRGELWAHISRRYLNQPESSTSGDPNEEDSDQ